MKRLFSESVNTVLRSFVGLALLAVMIVGCSNNPDKLSSGTIEDLVEELLEDGGYSVEEGKSGRGVLDSAWGGGE